MESFRMESTSKVMEFNLCHSTAKPVPKCHINTVCSALPGTVTPHTTALGSSARAWQPFPLKKFNLIANLTLLRTCCPKDTSVVNQRCIIFPVCSKYLLAQSQVAKCTITTVSEVIPYQLHWVHRDYYIDTLKITCNWAVWVRRGLGVPLLHSVNGGALPNCMLH